MFDLRFVFDCYHMLIYGINGIYVTDYYIQTIIENKFNDKNFLSYQQSSLSKIQKEKKSEDKSKDKKMFFGFELNLPKIDGNRQLTDFHNAYKERCV